jgi:aldose 1-epimerase
MQAKHVLVAGALRAVVLPSQGMLCCSLQHAGVELLREVDDLETRAQSGRPAGIPLLYPWANRLECPHFSVLGRAVALDLASPDLLTDENGLPLHGVPWSRLPWTVVAADAASIQAHLAWDTRALLAVFPFSHDLRLQLRLDPHGLTFDTQVHARADAVPVAFGFHPYFGLAGPRSAWQLGLPSLTALALDARMLPTGERRALAARRAALGTRSFDHAFALCGPAAEITLDDGTTEIGVLLLQGYRALQVYAPAERDFIAIEPMTAVTNALVRRRELPVVAPGDSWRALWRVQLRSAPLRERASGKGTQRTAPDAPRPA